MFSFHVVCLFYKFIIISFDMFEAFIWFNFDRDEDALEALVLANDSEAEEPLHNRGNFEVEESDMLGFDDVVNFPVSNKQTNSELDEVSLYFET